MRSFGDLPAFTGFMARGIIAPGYDTPLWPNLFVTFTCGACSDWHGLVAAANALRRKPMRSNDSGSAPPTTYHHTIGRAWLVVALAVVALGAKAPEEQHAPHAMANRHRSVQDSPALMSAATPFGALMGEAMVSMDDAMKAAPMTGDPDHDFAAMMIPHHQGAIDMAKAELLYGKNPVLRRLAQEIVVTQNSEIAVLQRELGEQRTSGAMQD
jgi:Domain of unknown function (DUF305)